MALDSSIHFALSKKQQEAVALVEEDFRMSSNAKTDYMRKALEWYRKYNMYVKRPEKKVNQRKARIAKPHGYAMVEHATANMKAVLFPTNANEQVIRVRPIGKSDLANADAVTSLLNYQLTQSQIRLKGEMWLRNFNIFGICAIYPLWRRIIKTRNIRDPIDQRDPETGQITRIGLAPPQRREITLFDDPDFEVGDIEDFYPDPAAISFQPENMRWVIRLLSKDYDSLKLEVESNPDMYDLKAFNLIRKSDSPPMSGNDDFRNEITRYHQYSVDGEPNAQRGIVQLKFHMSDDRFIMIANDQIPIMDIENPYWLGKKPCIVSTRLPITNYPWGKGRIEPIDKTLDMMQALGNSILDTTNLSVNPPWLMRRGVVDKSSLRNVPDNVIEVMGNLDDIKKLEIQDTTGPGMLMLEVFGQELEMTEPTLGLSRGEIPANIRSFSQQASLIEKVQERNQMDIDTFAESGLKPLAEWFYSLDQMFITEEKLIQVLEDDVTKWVSIGPEELMGNYNIEIDASARSTPKAVEAQQRFLFMQQIAPILQNPAGFSDSAIEIMAEIAKDVGYDKIAELLRNTAHEARLIQLTSPPIDPNNPAQGSQGNQGANGVLAVNTSQANTPTTEQGLVDQAANLNSPEDITVI